MNSQSEQNQSPLNFEDDEVDPKNDQIASLEDELEKIKDARKEDWFIFAELCSKNTRPGWDAWGDQLESGVV